MVSTEAVERTIHICGTITISMEINASEFEENRKKIFFDQSCSLCKNIDDFSI